MNLKALFLHLFVPQETNNHRAHLLRPSVIGILLVVYFLNISIIRLIALVRPGVLGYSSSITAEKIIELTNIERAKNNLPPLKQNTSLTNAATLKAGDMFSFNYWAHYSPSGRSPWDFLHQVNYRYVVAGENLARDFAESKEVVSAWMNSPTHRSNVLHTKYQEIGVAVVDGTIDGVGTTLVVQMFGTPTPVIATSSPVQEVLAAHKELQTDPAPTTIPVFPPDSSLSPATPKSAISPLALTKTLGTLLFILVCGSLIFDTMYILKNKIYRHSGSTVSQIVFLGVLFLFMLSAHPGAIF